LSLLRLFMRLTGLDSTIKEVVDEIVGSTGNDPKVMGLLRLVPPSPSDGTTELMELAKSLGIEVKPAVLTTDLRRRATALAANTTTVNVENPEAVLWEIAQRFRVRGRRDGSS
jgi:hypothetical protein